MERIPIDLHRWEKDYEYNCSPIITAKIDMCTVLLLIDSGAGLSYLDKSFVKKHPLLSHFVEDINISCVTNMVGGSTISEEVLNTENLIFRNGKYTHQFNLIDLTIKAENEVVVYNGILGFDFLMRYGARIDFRNNTLTI